MSSDILTAFAERLREAGLVVERIEPDGLLHRCGVSDKPNGTDGAYKAFLDAPASLWWKNWRTGDSGTWCAKAETSLSAAEREALKARIAEAKAAATKEREERHAKAAERAEWIWSRCPAATAEHPYLQRKEVPSFGLRLARDGRLVVPVRDGDGKLQSLQFIDDDGGKLFLSGGKTAGGHFVIPGKNGFYEGPLLIAEGYATGASLHLATGAAVVVVFSAGNLEAVAKLFRQRFPNREILLCADNDCENAKPDGTPYNPGVEAATRAAATVGAKLAICPAIDGKKADFNDLHTKRGLGAVKTAVEAVRKKADCPMPEGFYLKPEGKAAGLYKLETKGDGDSNEIRLGPPLFVKGLTRDADSNAWGLMLKWCDPDGRLHQWAMPLELLSRQGAEWYCQLANGGWFGIPGTRAKLAAFLSLVRPEKRIRCVPRVGWHGGAFVLPDAVFGAEADEEIVLQSANHARLYGTGGTPEGWRELAALVVGNSRLELALCAALAGPLLALAGLESGGFNLVGGSSTGKTTGLRLAGSVWDAPSYVRSWRTTDNALEGLATLHNDTILILDELGQAAAKAVSEAAYMLTNGQGKARSNRDGSAKKAASWRLLFLSSGEVGLADKLTEIGQKPRAGQEVRLVDIPADAGAGMGVFETLHGLPDAGSLSLRIKELTERHYGHAGRAFLHWLVSERETVAQDLRNMLTELVQRLCPDDADGQVRRVALRFAVCAAAGLMAKHAGVLPPELDAMGCAERCFRDWLNQRGGSGASEDAAILAAVRLFIEQHGASRFQDMANPAATCINRVGFRQTNGAGQTEYVVLPESFKAEVVRGCNPTKAARVLAAAGWLFRDGERLTTKRLVPDLGRVRCYVLLMPEGEADV